MVSCSIFDQKLAKFWFLDIEPTSEGLMVLVSLIFGQKWNTIPFFNISFTKKFWIYQNFSEKVKKNFQNFSPTPTSQNFFTFLDFAVLSCFGAYCQVQYAWETVQLTYWSWKIKKISMRPDLRDYWKFLGWFQVY